ncbi:MAG: hypothetical protein ACLQQ4_04100 [Bacteroidia bacterium]
MRLSKQKKALFILVGIAVIIKLIILHGVGNFRVWEENEIALNYLKTGQMAYYRDGVMVYNFGFPVYPFLLIILYKLFGVNYAYAAILNIIFSALTAVLFYDVLDAFFERFNLPQKVKEWKTGILLLSVAACLFHPLIMYYELKNVHPFAMYVFLYVWGLWMMVKYFEKSTWRNLTLYALATGLITLARATLVTLLLPFFFWLLQRDKIKKTFSKMVYIIVIASLFSIIWMLNVHYKVDSGNLMPNLGKGMWMGSLPQTEGSNNFPDGRTFYSALADSDLMVISKIPPARRDSFYREKYMNTLKNHPRQIAKLFFIKFKNFWLFRKAIGVDYPEWVQKLIPVYKGVYVIILLLALVTAIIIGRQAFILLSVPFAVSLMHAVVYVETRHRIMFEPVLIFLAIIGVALLINKVKRESVTHNL